jgi:hypothetical protein
MRIAVLTLGLVLISTAVGASEFVGPPPRGGWYATNQDLFCSLKRIVDTSDVKLEFLFVARFQQSSKPPAITFQVNATPAQLAWPVRFTLGSNTSEPPVEVGAASASSTFLSGPDVNRLLGYLRDGKGLNVDYSLLDGIKRRVYLDAFNFPQSAAMFDACAAHVA